MTIYSFRKLNPDWKITLVVPLFLNDKVGWEWKQYENNHDCFDYFGHITSQLAIRPMIFDFDEIGLSNDLNEVHKSDFLRYYLLHKHGGVWSDMDILYIKPMDMLRQNKDVNKSDAYYFWDSPKRKMPGHAIGFLMSTPGSQYFSDLFEEAKRSFNASLYQTVGADMLNPKFPPGVMRKKYPNAVNLDEKAVYAINHVSHDLLYNKSNLRLLTNDSIGLHWYGGSPFVGDLIVNVNHTNFKTYNNHGTLMECLRRHFSNDF
jgi:hypothetical protein